MTLLRLIAGIVLALFALPAPALAAQQPSEASPFIFSQSALAPAPSRGWVVLLPGKDELGFKAASAHYEKVALLLNANGFDTLIVPYEEAYDEDVDGDLDNEGDRIAAVVARAVRWMRQAHPATDGDPGVIMAWAQGAQGLAVLASTGSAYPLPKLAAAVAFYPDHADDHPFNSRLPMLVLVGSDDEGLKQLRRYVEEREPGSVEPDVVEQKDAQHAFDFERFAEPKSVRSMPLIGATVTFAYNAAAARLAQQKMLTFLKARLEMPE